MAIRTITALYDTRAAAEAAKARLVALSMADSAITIHDSGVSGAGGKSGLLAGLTSLFGSHEDTHAYEEGLRRGHFLLSAKVDEAKAEVAIQTLEQSDAIDFDHKQSEWKAAGWTAPAAAEVPSTSAASTAPQVTAAETDTSIPVIEERLVVGKREVERGGVRVRSYVVETPVEEQVSLREEHVEIQRSAVDRAVVAGEDAFRERTLTMTETGEEAVVGKQAVIKEEIVVRKDVGERTEDIRDTVRHTEVDIERIAETETGNKKPGVV